MLGDACTAVLCHEVGNGNCIQLGASMDAPPSQMIYEYNAASLLVIERVG